MPIPTEKELLTSAVHFGHRKEKWNPKMKPYLYGVRKGIHIFDLAKTRIALQKVCDELRAMQKSGKTILFVSTKPQGITLVEEIGHMTGQPIVTKKWMPGLITNWLTMKRRIRTYLDLQSSFKTGEVEKYTKKEQTQLRKQLTKLDLAFSGVATLKDVPDAIFVVDAIRDHVAVLEAKKLGIPVYGICDSNADPDEFIGAIPANDDAVKSIEIILKTVGEELATSKKEEDEKN
jgi:small subunit ribosomal protein S2